MRVKADEWNRLTSWKVSTYLLSLKALKNFSSNLATYINHVYSYAFHSSRWASGLYYRASICRYVNAILPSDKDAK